MADDKKLTELDALPLPVAGTDKLYVVRSTVSPASREVTVADLRALVSTPSGFGASGSPGQIAYDSANGLLWFCVAANVWVNFPIAAG